MQAEIKHLTMAELEAGLENIRNSPKELGPLDLIVSRPNEDEREVMELADLNVELGLLGDTWKDRPSARSADGKAHPDMQITIMNSRVANLVAQDKSRWPLAGDQLFADLDLSAENVPPGTRLSLGEAVLEATDQPHTGCKKFSARFGADALKLISSPIGKELQLRGINCKVVQSGSIKPGDTLKKL
ncbi:MAG: MOSC domain-containing protein [SAR202 cluster bacterium]|nr:MOSC domain-containing protein [Chloroflexota bacterium]MQG34841.1 MOSC domain-containing protein [SAR202 cluster bacterium]HCP23858.1 MOSC domain-containing protein [Dehalococcoidia bacterium]|tara:strand:- start:174 stop:734 length:561 start_codon:yes stop_codon:yes gene_type:complete